MILRLLLLILAMMMAAPDSAHGAAAGIIAPTATIVREPCPDPDAPSECVIGSTIYYPANASRFALEHGRGHVFDHEYLDDGERHKLARLMGASGPWRVEGATGLAGLHAPSERFADAYAACRLGLDPETRWESGYDYQPTRRQLRRVCGTISRAI